MDFPEDEERTSQHTVRPCGRIPEFLIHEFFGDRDGYQQANSQYAAFLLQMDRQFHFPAPDLPPFPRFIEASLEAEADAFFRTIDSTPTAEGIQISWYRMRGSWRTEVFQWYWHETRVWWTSSPVRDQDGTLIGDGVYVPSQALVEGQGSINSRTRAREPQARVNAGIRNYEVNRLGGGTDEKGEFRDDMNFAGQARREFRRLNSDPNGPVGHIRIIVYFRTEIRLTYTSPSGGSSSFSRFIYTKHTVDKDRPPPDVEFVSYSPSTSGEFYSVFR